MFIANNTPCANLLTDLTVRFNEFEKKERLFENYYSNSLT